jgi:hypothetical protein
MLRSRPRVLKSSLIFMTFLTPLGNLLTRISVVKPFKTVETEKVHVDAHGRIRRTGSKVNTMPI